MLQTGIMIVMLTCLAYVLGMLGITLWLEFISCIEYYKNK